MDTLRHRVPWFFNYCSGYLDTVTGNGSITLPKAKAKANGVKSVKLFGGCEQRNLPEGYTEVNGVKNARINNVTGYVDTGIIADVDDMEFDIVATINSSSVISWYILQSRENSSGPIYGLSGSTSNNTFIGSFSGTNISIPYTTLNRQEGHSYHVNFVCKNGTGTLIVEDLTDGVTATATGSYTFVSATTNIGLFSNLLNGGTLSYGNTSVKSAYIKKSGVKVIDYTSCTQNNVAGFYDSVTDSFVGATKSELAAGTQTTPTPAAPMNIVCNNGVLKYSANMANVNKQTVLLGYYISQQGALTTDTNNWTYQNFIPVKPNTTYTLSMSTSVYYVTISEYSTADNSGFIVRKAGSSGGNTSLTITTGATTNFLRFGTNIDRTSVTLEEVLAINWMLNIGTTMAYQPYVEGGIYTDGTVETVQLTGKNLFDKNTALLGDISTSGSYTSRTYRVVSDYIPVRFGQTFVGSGTLVDTDGVSYSAQVIKAFYKADKSYINGSRGSVTGNKFTINDETCAYIRIVFFNQSLLAGKTVSIENSVLQLELGSTATTYAPYYNGGTATSEMLLSAGNYKDIQSVLDGAVTRNVGIKVLDGTENWAKGTSGSNFAFYIDETGNAVADSGVSCMSTIAVGVTNSWGVSGVTVRSNKNFGFVKPSNMTIASTVTDWTTYLSTQYANGTPVIVVYPLATATTGTVTPQTLQTQAGTNILQITQASIDNLPLEATYKRGK